MRVIEVTKYGGPEVLKPADWPDPTPTDGKVRVRVIATTVGAADLVAREGGWAALTPNAKPPIVLGWDYVGELLDPAPGMRVGQRVAGMYPWAGLADGTGTYAEMVLADPGWFTAVPDGADPIEAATLAINGLAALQALRHTDVRAGQSLLVTGAGGTVGAVALQLAVDAGVNAIAVTSRGDEDYVSSLGAKEIVERVPGEDLVATVQQRYPDGVDAVLDASAKLPALITAVRDGGAFASVSDLATPPAERGIRVDTIHSQPEPDSLADLLGRLAAGQLRTRVADVLPLNQAAEAHRRVAAGSLRGKLVLTP
jgi:NADPH:quinone reductase-like Zn-dependent oxidoreductase